VNQCRKPALFLIATAVGFARAGTFVAALSMLCTNVMGAQSNAQPIAAPSAPTIYKLVDANGRVTYSNSPTKGAAKVELDPITVIPSTPAGMLGGGQANVGTSPNASQAAASPELIPVGIAPSIARPEAPTMPLMPMVSPSVQPTFAAGARTPMVQPATATVTPVSASIANRAQTPVALVTENETAPANKLPVVKLSPREAVPSDATVQTNATAPSIAMVAPPQPVAIATANVSPITTMATATATTTTSRETELRPQATIASPKFSQEEQLLAQLKARLVEEQNASASFRAMRARLPTTIDQSNPEKAAIQNDIKAQVEQHFERIRNLQDQIAQREQILAALRQ
jgi:Domain of unknown function (DUF4124)